MWLLSIILTFTQPTELKAYYYEYESEKVCRAIAGHYRQAKFDRTRTIKNVYATCNFKKREYDYE